MSRLACVAFMMPFPIAAWRLYSKTAVGVGRASEMCSGLSNATAVQFALRAFFHAYNFVVRLRAQMSYLLAAAVAAGRLP